MARSVGSATISFGAMAIRVKLYLAAKADSVSFSMITPAGNKVKQKLVDAETGKEVERKDTLKGFEYEKGKFAIFTEEEVKSMHAAKTDRMDVKEFVPQDCINVLHVEKSFYTAPDKGADRAYAVLAEGLRQTGRAAVATWAARGKEHLVVLRATDEGIICHQMYYSTEVRAFDTPVANMELTDQEVQIAKLVIEGTGLTSDEFDNSHYYDQFEARVADAVQKKLAGEEIAVPAEGSTPSLNVTDALQATLEMLKKQGKPDKPAAKPKAAPAPKKAGAKKAAKKAAKKPAKKARR
jgi:DNA end-binding protein Ku